MSVCGWAVKQSRGLSAGSDTTAAKPSLPGHWSLPGKPQKMLRPLQSNTLLSKPESAPPCMGLLLLLAYPQIIYEPQHLQSTNTYVGRVRLL